MVELGKYDGEVNVGFNEDGRDVDGVPKTCWDVLPPKLSEKTLWVRPGWLPAAGRLIPTAD